MPRKASLSFKLFVNENRLYKEFDFLGAFNAHTSLLNKTIDVTFVDEFKNKHEAKISGILGNNNTYHCFWDHHPIEGREPLQCPIRKVYKHREKTYTSGINNNTYLITDSLNTDKTEYDTMDFFCSPECCLAFIQENKHNPLYQYSEVLLRELIPYTIQPAPHWRMLTCYGGKKSIQEFRECFNKKSYTFEGIITRPLFFAYKENYHL